jgi:hypothetical protein
MMEKVILCAERDRKITGTFGFIEHRFLQEGFFYALSHCELCLLRPSFRYGFRFESSRDHAALPGKSAVKPLRVV